MVAIALSIKFKLISIKYIMRNQYNTFKPNFEEQNSNEKHNNFKSQSSKLYSSERLSPASLPQSSKIHGEQIVTATEMYFNLNSSLDGLLSKIEAIKVEHKNPKPFKKMQMDLSSFPMPNLSNNAFFAAKNLPKPPVFAKTNKINQFNDQDNHLKKQFKANFTKIDTTKVVNPLVQQIKNNPTQISEAPIFPFKSIQQSIINAPVIEETKPKALNKGIFNILPNNLKVSMEMSSQDYQKLSIELGLEKIIKKNAEQGQILNKSKDFGMKVSLKDFQLGKNVGSGKFGDVHICRYRATGGLFALKKIFKSTILEYNMITQFTRELKIHYRLDHPNIIKLYTHFDDEYHIFLLMEYAQGGILMDRLKCTEEIASRFVDQTMEAVQYLHKNMIAHRDIKPENIVLQFGTVVKLCDFGWASTYDNQMKTTFCGTLDYLSPQMKEGGRYDNSVDVWSIGVLTFQLITGDPPYRKELMLAMKNGVGPSKPGARKINWAIKYPSSVSPLAESFIRNILKQNPDERATLRFCSTHMFIRKYRQEDEQLPLYQELMHILIKMPERVSTATASLGSLHYNSQGFGFNSVRL